MLQRERAAGRANLRLGKPNSRAACVMISMLRWCRRACHVLGPGGGCEQGGACAGPEYTVLGTRVRGGGTCTYPGIYTARCAQRVIMRVMVRWAKTPVKVLKSKL